MLEARDPAIKLFGRTIASPEGQQQVEEAAGASTTTSQDPAGDGKETCHEVLNFEVKEPNPDVSEEADKHDFSGSSSINKPSGENQQSSVQNSQPVLTDHKPEQDPDKGDGSGQEKVLKKPDKILACPRCNSMDTKFCYYNNYNVNQPRHFCKSCHRYWTAGGTMRNVPVGAGRRKNKHSSQYRHLMMTSDGTVKSNKVEPQELVHHQDINCGIPEPVRPVKANGSLLKFGSETPLCESMASVLHLGDQERNAELASVVHGENIEENSCASTVTSSNCVKKELPEKGSHLEKNSMQSNSNSTTPIRPVQCYTGPPFIYPWVPAISAGQCSSDRAHGPENSTQTLFPWVLPPVVATPAFCASAISFPFMPTSFWGSMSSWPGGVWSAPWVGSTPSFIPSSSTSNTNCSGNGSPTLGKHSRDNSSLGDEKVEKSLWIPKTLRIDDPGVAAKSSIWATLGIKSDEGGIFKTAQAKAVSKTQTSDASEVLQANPAALSRSQTFQENT